MSLSGLIERFQDPYEKKARIFPGLLVILPITVPLVCNYGPKHPLLTAVLTLLAGCGAIYTIAAVSRGLGKAVEEKLVSDWGGLPTTIVLRHRDSFLDAITKKKYHGLIASKFDLTMPSSEEEQVNPYQADEAYRAVGVSMRALTRDTKKYALLFKENIAYGFHRNMLGLKPIGIVTSFGGIVYAALAAQLVSAETPYVRVDRIVALDITQGLTLAVSSALLLAWIAYFNKKSVRRIAFSYAERLLEALNSVPKPKQKSKSEQSI